MRIGRWAGGIGRGALAGLVLALALASPAAAVLVDFTSGEFAASSGQRSYTTVVDGLRVSVEARLLGTALTPTAHGLGVDGITPWDDPSAIDVGEWLTVRFDSAQLIEEVYVDLLASEREVGWYRVGDGALQRFHARDAIDGALALAIGESASSISFMGYSLRVFGWESARPSDFVIAGLRTAGSISPGTTRPIPEPGSLAMFGIGGLLVGWTVRRRV